MLKLLKKLMKDQKGLTMTEYGAGIAFVVLPVAAMMNILGESIVARGLDASANIQTLDVHYLTDPAEIDKDSKLFEADRVRDFDPSKDKNKAPKLHIRNGKNNSTHNVNFQ